MILRIFFAYILSVCIGITYVIWVERHNRRIKQIIEEKKASSELCRKCLKYQKCYALCNKYRVWERKRRMVVKKQ